MIGAGAGLLCGLLCGLVRGLLCGLLCGLFAGLLCGLLAGLFAGLPPEQRPELLGGVSSTIGAPGEPGTVGAFPGPGLSCPCIGIVA